MTPTNSRDARLGHLLRATAGPGTFGGAKDSLPDGRDRNAGTGVPWDDGGSVLRQYGEDTKLDLKNSSWQQRISDSDLDLAAESCKSVRDLTNTPRIIQFRISGLYAFSGSEVFD